jgi:hypothetical protein
LSEGLSEGWVSSAFIAAITSAVIYDRKLDFCESAHPPNGAEGAASNVVVHDPLFGYDTDPTRHDA